MSAPPRATPSITPEQAKVQTMTWLYAIQGMLVQVAEFVVSGGPAEVAVVLLRGGAEAVQVVLRFQAAGTSRVVLAGAMDGREAAFAAADRAVQGLGAAVVRARTAHAQAQQQALQAAATGAGDVS